MWLHPRVIATVARAHASVLLISFEQHELPMRNELVDLAATHNLRHAHMVGVERESMVRGLAIDPRRIDEQMRALQSHIKPTSQIKVRSTSGTDLTIKLVPRYRWLVCAGIVRPGTKENLPSGELVTHPDDVDGVYVADGTLGDADGLLTRSLSDSPLRLRIASGKVVSVESNDAKLASTVSEHLRSVARLDRVGLVGFGLNAGIEKPLGNVFTDQKVPGVHLSLGETFPGRTGASWTSTSWIALTTAGCDASVDDFLVLKDGRFVL
jgi:leucyl aminopeptidase (aminopeptidase T)